MNILQRHKKTKNYDLVLGGPYSPPKATDVAKEYCAKMLKKAQEHKKSTGKTFVWTSDNLPILRPDERRAVLKIYKKHFKVDYNATTGLCLCHPKEEA